MMNNQWSLELDQKSDFDHAMQRIYAWYEKEMIDRPPIRFSAHNAKYSASPHLRKTWPTLKNRWFDAEYQVDLFIDSIKDRKFYAETFPIFCPNLGPEAYTAFHGSKLEYKEVTSYAVPFVKDWEDMDRIRFDWENPYLKKIDEMMQLALEKCSGKFMVGYTDLHPGIDCMAALRDPQNLCVDTLLYPDEVKKLGYMANEHFQELFDHYDRLLKKYNQLSVAWMGLPSYGKMHIPSCDFIAMISPEQFDEFVWPIIQEEIKPMTHNVFHVDGKGVANHIDRILAMPEINAIQWVQGMGDNYCELWLSTDSLFTNKVKIANVIGWTKSREWEKQPNQKSGIKKLTAGTRYYFEALMKEATGGDNLAIGWIQPGPSTISIIGPPNIDKYTDDFEGPFAPLGLDKTMVTSNSFILKWLAAIDNYGINGYDIYKDGSFYASTSDTSLIISGLKTETSYTMAVKAKDAAGYISDFSNNLDVKTTINTGINDAESPDIKVFPNPANSNLTIANIPFNSNIHIFTTLGEIMLAMASDKNVINIDVQNWRKGLYFVLICDKQNALVYKIIVE